MRTLTVKTHVSECPAPSVSYLDVSITDKGESKAYIVGVFEAVPNVVYWAVCQTQEQYRVQVVSGVPTQCECLAAQHRPNMICRHRAATAKLMTMNKLQVG